VLYRHERRARDDQETATNRAPMAGGPEPTGSSKTRMPSMMATRFAATEVRAMTSTAGPIWRLRGDA
jgi:hypothetical protein